MVTMVEDEYENINDVISGHLWVHCFTYSMDIIEVWLMIKEQYLIIKSKVFFRNVFLYVIINDLLGWGFHYSKSTKWDNLLKANQSQRIC